VVKTAIEGGSIAVESQVAVPALVLALEDYYGAVVTSDSNTAVIAGVDLGTQGLESTQGRVEVVQNGCASFDSLAFDTKHKTVELDLVFSAPALPRVAPARSLSVVVSMPSKPTEETNELKGKIAAWMLLLAVVNLVFTLFCAAWTYNYRERTIVELSQPKFLYQLCGGCFISTISSVAPLLGSNTLACQMMVWLYGCGFVVTTATLYFKMQHMNKMVENSITTNVTRSRAAQGSLSRV